ncbi:AMP-binding protein [Mycobacterium sp. SM1]|uniref:AMP-binding protein n=1 Tax=Mycobacterium sp. SM1 TaxID=2816243 RepID=UPI001BCC106C|nr:AMP-binding protein [Mycobacterium sp. SM1]MBS4728163.1 AMP-binding protein [Mycobacterium sp. SM1]
MMALRVAGTTGRALLRSGLLKPPGPRALVRLAREAHRSGINVFTLLAIAAARWPDRAAVIDDDGVIGYRELLQRTESLARALYRHGVTRGQPVGILCRNGRGFVEAVFAVAQLGADAVLLNTEFRTDALTAALSTHRIATVVCDREFTGRVRAMGEHVLAVDPARVVARHGDPRPEVMAPGRIVLLTSGTTGKPKGVARTPRLGSTVVGVWATILDRAKLRTGSRISVATPMFHGLGLGMVLLTVGLGGTILTRRRFDAEAALAQASLHRADAFTAVPVMLARILDLPAGVRARNPVPALRVVLSSGDRLDPSVVRRFMAAYGDVLYNAYGSTEVGIGAFATPTDLREAPETVGRPIVGCPVRILSRNDAPVGPGVIGRVFVGGDLTFEGYIGGGATSVVNDMTSTGDMGYFDESGRLFLVGREDDMIVSGGENVYPSVVENALAQHPGITESAVVGVRDERFGYRLAAFVVPRPGSGVDEAAVREYLKDKVSRFEQPRDVRIVSGIPRNPAGKVLRNELPI